MKMPPRPDHSLSADAALDALFAAARARQPDTSRAEFGFETRLLARMAAERAEATGWREFTIWCWRLLPGLAVVTLAFTLWNVRPDAAAPTDDLLLAATVRPAPADDDDVAQWMAVELLAPI